MPDTLPEERLRAVAQAVRDFQFEMNRILGKPTKAEIRQQILDHLDAIQVNGGSATVHEHAHEIKVLVREYMKP